MRKVLIIGSASADTVSYIRHVDDADNNQDIVLPIKLSKIEHFDLPIRKQCKRRKFKSYFGKTYESEYG